MKRCSTLSVKSETAPGLFLAGANLPQHLSQHAQPEFGVPGLQAEAAHQAAYLVFSQGFGARIHIPAGAQGLQQYFTDSLDFARANALQSLRLLCCFGIAT